MAVASQRARPAARAPADSRQVTIAPRTLLIFVLLAAGVFLAGQLVFAVRTTLVQLVVAIVVAMAIEPLVRVFEARGVRRGGAVAVAFSLVAVALIAFAYLLFQPLVTEL